MANRIAIIGSGPTGIYTLRGLIDSAVPLEIAIYELQADPGKGMPYHPAYNDPAMLANIASIELPPVCETLVDWLQGQSDENLSHMGVVRENIADRTFFPRVVLGDYFQAQLRGLVDRGRARGHRVDVLSRHRVKDIALQTDDIRLAVGLPDGTRSLTVFNHVVMATGHSWTDKTEVKPGYFIAPWPADALETIENCRVGILGTSLSAIDALVAVASRHGSFYYDQSGQLEYQPAAGADAFDITLMSRKGLLPEADFYCPIPYEPLEICTDAAVDTLIESGRDDLLDATFSLFCAQLTASDPDYAASIGLSRLTVETIGPAYFAERETRDPFVWAALNLAEARHNADIRHTVAWRYAILRMHEVIARIVPALNAADLERFHTYFKTLFVDDYATVPHLSIERLLALRRAGKLNILKLGSDYTLDTKAEPRGVALIRDGQSEVFEAFIDATGQQTLSAGDIPFPTLIRQGVVHTSKVRPAQALLSVGGERDECETGGIALDAAYRLVFDQQLCNRLYCVALSFLLRNFPFVQGITSAHELGTSVSSSILEDIGSKEEESTTLFQLEGVA